MVFGPETLRWIIPGMMWVMKSALHALCENGKLRTVFPPITKHQSPITLHPPMTSDELRAPLKQ
jgi:hypothetical protein